MAKMTSELDEADAGCSSGAKYLGFFSSPSMSFYDSKLKSKHSTLPSNNIQIEQN